MEGYVGKSKPYVWDRLSRDRNISRLLATESGQANVVVVEEGTVDATQAKTLVSSGLANLKGKLRRSQKKWAQSFRNQINDYVYRKGNGNLPQTWPLIRKTVLYGPWACLSTGACLVDLAGTRYDVI